jgi:hypothetical protein
MGHNIVHSGNYDCYCVIFFFAAFQSAPSVLPMAVIKMKSILGQLRCRIWRSNGKLEQCAPQKSERIRAQLRVRVDQWVVDMPEMLRPGLDRRRRICQSQFKLRLITSNGVIDGW